MKSIIYVLFIFIYVNLSAQDDASWRLIRSNLHYENDLLGLLNNDSEYTSGLQFSNVYKLPVQESQSKIEYVSLGLAQEIFTPADTNQTQLIVNDRPYAGWLYFEFGYHQSSVKELTSWSVQAGVVGKASLAEASQNFIHKIRGLELANGWDNQLHNELGINLIYQHKWRYTYDAFLGLEGDIVPFVGASLGNVSTFARAGTLLRIGHNPADDFGSSTINVGGENGIPVAQKSVCPKDKPWSYTLNIAFAGTAVAHDMFLDGNTFTKSHSVEKKNLIGYIAYGLSMRYKNISFDYILTASTKQFNAEQSGHQYGSILLSYLY
jgi:hypothetical protein